MAEEDSRNELRNVDSNVESAACYEAVAEGWSADNDPGAMELTEQALKQVQRFSTILQVFCHRFSFVLTHEIHHDNSRMFHSLFPEIILLCCSNVPEST